MDRRTAGILIERLNRDAERIAGYFGLRYKSITAERANVKRRYGVCFEDGAIKIRLRHAISGKPLRYSSLIDTLCHELAHLRHFDHGPHFRAFHLQILGYARSQGIYRPRPRGSAGPALLRVAAREAVPTARHRPKAAGPEQLALL
jgi:predicted metal-dependent hydrolase